MYEELKINYDEKKIKYPRTDELIQLPIKFKKILNEVFNKYEKNYYILIDSRDRNQDLYLNTNKYRIKLPFELKNIKSISLINAAIPNTQYVINENNNKIYFQETNLQVTNETYYTSTIPVGYYTLSELLTEIMTQMNSVGLSSYTVTENENKINILSDLTGGDNLFNLIFAGNSETFGDNTRTTYISNSIGPVIGFDKTNLTGSSSYTGTKDYNLSEDPYLFLNIENINNKIFSSKNYTEDNIFGKIPLNVDKGEIKFYSSNKGSVIKQNFFSTN